MEKTVAGKLSKGLKKLLKNNVVNQEVSRTLHLQERRLAATISTKMGIECAHGDMTG